MMKYLFRSAVIFASFCWCAIGCGQDLFMTAPFQSTNDSFHEVIGTGFNFDNGSVQFSWRPNVLPQFGGFNPNNGARLNVNSGPLSLSLFGSQGSNRSSVTQTPMLTVPNGGTGYFIDAQVSPFVVGFEPIVGSQPIVGVQPMMQGPTIQERWEATRSLPQVKSEPARRRIAARPPTVSSAEFGDISVAEIRQRKAHQPDAQSRVDELIGKSRAAADEGKWKLAKNYLRNALRTADSTQRAVIQAQLNRIHDKNR